MSNRAADYGTSPLAVEHMKHRLICLYYSDMLPAHEGQRQADET